MGFLFTSPQQPDTFILKTSGDLYLLFQASWHNSFLELSLVGASQQSFFDLLMHPPCDAAIAVKPVRAVRHIYL